MGEHTVQNYKIKVKMVQEIIWESEVLVRADDEDRAIAVALDKACNRKVFAYRLAQGQEDNTQFQVGEPVLTTEEELQAFIGRNKPVFEDRGEGKEPLIHTEAGR
jgi:hypothetical protein